MPVVYYPPPLPLYEESRAHLSATECAWATPITFLPFLAITAVLFLAGVWGMDGLEHLRIFAELPSVVKLLIVSLVPPLLLILAILQTPRVSSPLPAYQAFLARAPLDPRRHWNLAVVAAAFVYGGGAVAQTEWLSLMPLLPLAERQRAVAYFKQLISRLQQIPVIGPWDIISGLLASILVGLASSWLLHEPYMFAIFHALSVLIVAQLLMLYLLLQRWQHVRRLMELVEIYEELLPSSRPTPLPVDDEVTRWAKTQPPGFHFPRK
jgi:hypothetical protein